MDILKAVNLIFGYQVYSGKEKRESESFRIALNGINLEIHPGDFVGILGPNGSGKSTLAKQLAGLLTPTEGYVYIDGLDSRDSSHSVSIRSKVGMVFQNPDNQIVGNVVEEDVAFGPENLGIPQEGILERVEKALETVSMSAYRYHSPGRLSGGQKQKVAIAGILAMEPGCIILDEPTAMLDPQGRQEVLEAIRYLNQEKKITIILITHCVEELEHADAVYVMKEGRIMAHGRPAQIWDQAHLLEECGIRLPFVLRLADLLRERNIPVPRIRTDREMLGYLEEEMTAKRYRQLSSLSTHLSQTADHYTMEQSDSSCTKQKEINYLQVEEIKTESGQEENKPAARTSGEPGQIGCRHVSYSYGSFKSGKRTDALRDVSFSMKKGEYLAVVGKTGSGKSTLLQHLNGLRKPTLGNCLYDGIDIHGPDISRKEVRQKVALCFQYPEYQLFEETVLKDICFGPANLGLPKWVCEKRAREAMELMGLPPDMESQSPLALSGGQKRKVALAGILAMDPEYLILDEPAAGMDQPGKDTLFHLLKKLNKEKKIGILFVSHDMDEVAEHADRLIVMEEGRIVMDGKPREVFSGGEQFDERKLEIPRALSFYHRLRESDFGEEAERVPITVEELADYIRGELKSPADRPAEADGPMIL